MKLLLMAGMVGLTLTGCATAPPVQIQTVGNFTSMEKTANEYIASDAVTQLKELYPPASTEFDLNQKAVDYFGVAFTGELRGAGYGLREVVFDEAGNVVTTPGNGRDLEYTIDSLGNEGVYLTITIDSQSISRSYLESNGTVAPTSAWNFKE